MIAKGTKAYLQPADSTGQYAYTNVSPKVLVGQTDKNTPARPYSVFPLDIYSGETWKVPDYVCSKPRDTRSTYIINREVDEHPQHFSRFGYEYWPNGYGQGNQSVGRYTVPKYCVPFVDMISEPTGVAPQKYYTDCVYSKYSTSSYGETIANETR